MITKFMQHLGILSYKDITQVPSLDAGLARDGCQGWKTGWGSGYCHTVLHEPNRKDKVA
jgi:hypothetical protein